MNSLTAIPVLTALPTTGVFALEHRVAEHETSALVPHANNVAILGWSDHIASAHGAAAGASREALAQHGRMWFVARHDIEYLGESFAGDDFILATWVVKLGRTSLERETRIFHRNAPEPIVRACSRWALVDLATRKPVAIDDAVRARLFPR